MSVVNLSRSLTAPEFQRLSDVPPETQWFANLDSAQTRRAYQNDLQAFMRFTGIVQPEEFRSVARSHVLAWRTELEHLGLSGATIRRKLAALGSLFDYLCDCNAVTHWSCPHLHSCLSLNRAFTTIGSHRMKKLQITIVESTIAKN